MSECSSKSPIHNVLWQAIWCLVALTVGPFLIGIFSFLSKNLGDWPCCPACGKKICRLLPTIASKRCLHCNTVIIEDKRQFVSGFELPPSLDEAIAKGIRVRSGGSDTQSLQSMRIVFIGTPMVVLSFFLVGVKGDIELEPLMENYIAHGLCDYCFFGDCTIDSDQVDDWCHEKIAHLPKGSGRILSGMRSSSQYLCGTGKRLLCRLWRKDRRTAGGL